MPPLVTVSAALLSTNTGSERGRNFPSACPAMTPAAAVHTLYRAPRRHLLSGPLDTELGQRLPRVQAFAPTTSSPCDRKKAATASEGFAQATDMMTGRQKREDLSLNFLKFQLSFPSWRTIGITGSPVLVYSW